MLLFEFYLIKHELSEAKAGSTDRNFQKGSFYRLVDPMSHQKLDPLANEDSSILPNLAFKEQGHCRLKFSCNKESIDYSSTKGFFHGQYKKIPFRHF